MNTKRSKKHNRKKAVTLTALAAVLLLSGCGKGGEASNESPDGKVTLNVLTQSSPLAPADPNEKLINKRLEEKRAFTSSGRIIPAMYLRKSAIWP